MSIASQLQAYQNGLTDAYNMVSQRGGTMPVHKNMSSLASSIATIPSGSQFTGIPKEVNAQGVYGSPAQTFSFSLPSTATDLAQQALYFAFVGCQTLTSADLSSLTTVSGYTAMYHGFQRCTSMTSVDLGSLTSVTNTEALRSAFEECTSLQSVDLSSLTTVSGSRAFDSAFSKCSSLSSIDLSSLTTVSGSNCFYTAFARSALTSVSFDNLSDISGSNAFYQIFTYCANLTTLSFPALTTTSFGANTNQFNSMLYRCSNVTVHFPSAIQSTIGSWNSVTSGFDGTNTTVLFDL